MPNLKIGEIHLTLLALSRPANRTSPACSIQFSFFLSAWFFLDQARSPKGSALHQNQATLSKIGFRGDKKVDRTIRSGHHCRLPIKSRSTEESLTCRALHRGGARLLIFKKTSTIFLSFFEVFLRIVLKPLIYQWFFTEKKLERCDSDRKNDCECRQKPPQS